MRGAPRPMTMLVAAAMAALSGGSRSGSVLGSLVGAREKKAAILQKTENEKITSKNYDENQQNCWTCRSISPCGIGDFCAKNINGICDKGLS